MRTHLLLLTLLSLAACADDDFPPGSPPGGGGMGGRTDAGVNYPADAGVVAEITGTVCQIDDIRVISGCVGAAGVTVAIQGVAGATAVSDADGKFSLPAQPDKTAIVLTTDDPTSTLAGSVVDVLLDEDGIGQAAIPVVTSALLAEILAANLIPDQGGSGYVVVIVSDGELPIPDAALGLMAGTAEPFYDVGDPQIFASSTGGGVATSAFGFAMYFNVPAGVVGYTVTLAGTPHPQTTHVVDGKLTFSVAFIL